MGDELSSFKLVKKRKKLMSAEEKATFKTQNISDARMHVSRLIFAALTAKIPVREALLNFPQDMHDSSVETAWHALCHREADDDLRRRDFSYAQEQDEYLEMIAFTLQKGEELPQNIIQEYKGYHQSALIPHSKKLKGIWDKLCTFLNI
ncbi:MAG: hypothetical protein PHV37_09425 [Candidatus Gastranaerophilales bacterium]|nr:hypothetical protein [Candidatus Gastranaerophilales bacterium]